MHRKEIDRAQYEAIRAALIGMVEVSGPVSITEGWHQDHGTVFLIRQTGRFFADADDASLIRERSAPAARSPIHSPPGLAAIFRSLR